MPVAVNRNVLSGQFKEILSLFVIVFMNFSVTLMSDIFVPIYYNHRKNDLGTKKLKLSCIFSEHILQGSKNVGKLHLLENF